MKIFEILTNSNYKIYIDIDGVLADFDQGINNMFRKMGIDDFVLDNNKYEKDKEYQKKMWETLNKYQKQGNNFWLELPLMSDANKLWKYVQSYDPTILSSAGRDDPITMKQKKEWVANKFGKKIPVIVTAKSSDKAKYATKKSILIDDRQKVIDNWEKSDGIGILHTSANNTITQLKKLKL